MRTLAVTLLTIGILSACGTKPVQQSESDIVKTKIDSLEAILFAESEKPADKTAGMDLVKSYAKYYRITDAKDSLAVDMLFKAGEVSMGIGQGNLAVKYFKMISDDHRDFYKAPEALFLAGFCEENVNKDTADARRFYELFVNRYPEHKLAEDAKFSIQNMKMSDEELIRMFEEKLKTES
jgi:hypothetical protein